jgi:hypothetical protein
MDRLVSNQQLGIDGDLRSPNGWLRLVLQTDGNLVLYRTQVQRALWATATDHQPVNRVVMQSDGNLVAVSTSGQPLWMSHTDGHPGASLVLQDDGNLVIYDAAGHALWASNTVQDFLSPVIHVGDGTYTYVETSESWKQMCSALPCFLALQWPGYATTIVETQIDGQDVVLQLWKGYCPKFLGHASFPGGIGAEVGVYRRIPGKVRPTAFAFLPGPLGALVGNALATLNDNDLWWPAPELNASIEMRLRNPVTGTTFLSAGPESSYWLTRWMNELDYLQYVFSHQAPAVWDFTAYVLEYSVNGQAFEPWTNQGPARQFHGSASGEINATVRRSDHLDVFLTDSSAVTRTGAWESAFTDGWHGWWELNGGRAAPGAPVTAVSRNVDKLDVFVVGTDGHIYTAAWQPAFADGWHGWWRIGDLTAPGGAAVHAVSRSRDKLDIFVTANDGHVYTAAWEPAFTDGWHGWWRVGDVTAPPGAPVHAVSRSTDKLDIFVTDSTGVIRTAAWEPAFTDGWRGWWELNGGRAAPGAPVTVVSRSTDKLDVFVTGTDHGVYTASWEPAFIDWWHGWRRIGP